MKGAREDWCLRSNPGIMPHSKRIVAILCGGSLDPLKVGPRFGRPLKKASRHGKYGMNRRRENRDK